jgi:hypothetical protein
MPLLQVDLRRGWNYPVPQKKRCQRNDVRQTLELWVVETSSRNEVVDSVGFVSQLINHVHDRLSAPLLPVVLAPSQTRTGPGEFSPSAPGRGSPSAGAQAQTAEERQVVLGGPEKRVAKLACGVLIVMTHERRKVVHFNITESPTAEWSAQQVVNAFPYDTAPTYLLRDRDSITERFSCAESMAWVLSRNLSRRDRPGKVPMSSDWSVLFGASAWIE